MVLDGNHPLAGISLNLTLKVCDVRPATEEEVEQGSVALSPLSLGGHHTAPEGTTLH